MRSAEHLKDRKRYATRGARGGWVVKLEPSSFCRDHACPARECLSCALVFGKVGKLIGGEKAGDDRLVTN